MPGFIVLTLPLSSSQGDQDGLTRSAGLHHQKGEAGIHLLVAHRARLAQLVGLRQSLQPLLIFRHSHCSYFAYERLASWRRLTFFAVALNQPDRAWRGWHEPFPARPSRIPRQGHADAHRRTHASARHRLDHPSVGSGTQQTRLQRSWKLSEAEFTQ